MTLIYRAIWDDDWCVPLAVLDDEFRIWCQSKGIDKDDIPYRGIFAASDRLSIEVRRADSEIGSAMRCTLLERDGQGRTWTTTATALADNETRSFWVDLECHDPSGRPPEMAAPRLVRGLIRNGGRPMSYGLPMKSEALQIRLDTVDQLFASLLDPSRLVPIVVFSPDPRTDAGTTTDRANAAAETLIGLAHTYDVDPQASVALNAALPEGLGVYGGAVRMYLPPLRVDDPDDPHRHRWIPLRLIADHPRRAASLLASRLARRQLHPPIPEAWDRLGALLRRPTEMEVETRANEITTSRKAVAPLADELSLRAEIDELTRLLAEADLLRETVEREAQAKIASLEASVSEGESERFDDADELEVLQQESTALRATIRAFTQSFGPTALQPTRSPRDIDPPVSIGEAIELARLNLPFVDIPDGALRDIDELEATAKYLVWASTIWQGLLALNEYAALKAGGKAPPGLKLWCERTGLWPTSKP